MTTETIFNKYDVDKEGKVTRIKTGRQIKSHGAGVKRNYRRVALMINGKRVSIGIHRLLALKFIPNPENKPMVNHIDGNPGNNSLENLEWATAKENVNHAFRTGLYINKKPKLNRICKVCKSEFKITEYIVNKGYGFLCSRVCFSSYRKDNPNVGMYGYKTGKLKVKKYCIRGHIRADNLMKNGDCRLCSRVRARNQYKKFKGE